MILRYCTGIILLLLFCDSPKAQNPVAAVYSKALSPDSIFLTLSILASDSLEGRETGKIGQKKAASLIVSSFQRFGLKPGIEGRYEQFHPITTRANEKASIEVNQQFFLFMKDYFYAPAYKDTMMVIDSVHFFGYGISDPLYDDFKNQNISGKTIMICEGEPKDKKGKSILTKSISPSAWSTDWRKKFSVLLEKKPQLVLILVDSIDVIADSLNYEKKTGEFLRFCKSPDAIPVIFINKTLALRFYPENTEEELTHTIRKISRKRRPFSFTQSTDAIIKMVSQTEPMMGQNIIGYIEGTENKEEALFITAHYDHLGIQDSLIHPGADDNASGTSAVIEIARQFRKAVVDGHPPRRSIYFMLVSGEEKGLLGSKYYVKRPVVSFSNTVADLNIDMIGRTDEKHDSTGQKNYIYIIGSDKLSTDLHQISESVNDSITKLELDYTYNIPGDRNRFYFRSDHYNFAKNNIPVIFYFNGTHKDYHRETDTIDKININLLTHRAQLVFLTAWELANRKDRIRVDKTAPKE